MTIYLYHKRHKITGLNYFGKTKGSDPIGYLGSGVYWRSHLTVHGEEVETLQLWEFDNQDECSKFAINFSITNNIVESEDWANLCIEDGIGGGDMLSQLPETRYKEICEGRSRKTKKSWENRSKDTQANTQSEIWANRSETIKNNIFNKISETLIKKSDEERAITLQKRRDTLNKRTEEDINREKELRKATLNKRPSLICPHCSLVSKSAVNMRRYHFDNCKLSFGNNFIR